MLGAPRIVDAIACAEVIEPIGPGRMPAARQQQSVDHALAGDRRLAGAFELRIEEAEIKRRIVRHQRRLADEADQLVCYR